MAKIPQPPKPKLPKPKKSLGQHIKDNTRKAAASSLRKTFGVLGDAVAKKYLAPPRVKTTIRVEPDTGNKKIIKKKLKDKVTPDQSILESAKQVTGAVEVVASNASRGFARASRQVDTMGEEVTKSLTELSGALDRMLYRSKAAPSNAANPNNVKYGSETPDSSSPIPSVRVRPKVRAKSKIPGFGKLGKWMGRGIAGLGTALEAYESYQEYRDTGNIGRAGAGFGGAMGGMAAGAAIGSAIPGLGTIVGGVIGATAGSILGRMGGHSIYDHATAAPGGKTTVGGSDNIIHKMKYTADKIKFVATGKIEFKSKTDTATSNSTPSPTSGGFFNRMIDKVTGGPGGGGFFNSLGDKLIGGRGGGGYSGGGGYDGKGGGPSASPGQGGKGGTGDYQIPPASKDKSGQYPENTERLSHQSGKLAGVDPRLMRVLKDSSKDLPDGYHAEIISGHDARSTGTKNHPAGIAADIKIYDSNGKLVPHDRGGPGMKLYEQYHQSMVERGKVLYPGEKFIWGGTWISGAAGHGDPMHMQILDPSVAGSSKSSGAYNDDKGAKGHPFEPYLMTDDERKSYKERIRDKLEKETAEGPAKDRPAIDINPVAKVVEDINPRDVNYDIHTGQRLESNSDWTLPGYWRKSKNIDDRREVDNSMKPAWWQYSNPETGHVRMQADPFWWIRQSRKETDDQNAAGKALGIGGSEEEMQRVLDAHKGEITQTERLHQLYAKGKDSWSKDESSEYDDIIDKLNTQDAARQNDDNGWSGITEITRKALSPPEPSSPQTRIVVRPEENASPASNIGASSYQNTDLDHRPRQEAAQDPDFSSYMDVK